MKNWSFHNANGDISPLTVCGPTLEFAQANAPAAHNAIEGRHDHRTHRVQNGAVVARLSPLPQSPTEALVKIVALEARGGPRAPREALLVVMPAGPERDRLVALDDEITVLRRIVVGKRP